jgi:hypothetical protein
MKLFKNNIIRNRKVTKARFLYLYVIFGSITGLVYFVASIFQGWPKHFALSPVYLLASFLVLHFLYKNWKLIWFYIINVERGKLLLFLNKSTHWEETHKIKVANWVYPSGNKLRKEIHDLLVKKAMDGDELSKIEKRLLKREVIICPQQLRIGFNEAMLVNALIYAHRNIKPLDADIRDIMNLTDDHILKFNLMREYHKARGDEYDKFIEIGKRKSAELSAEDKWHSSNRFS